MGKGLIAAIALGAGALGATAALQSGSPVVSLTDYGRDADAFRRALDRLERQGGGILDIPKGDYVVNGADLRAAIRLPANVLVRGNGARITITPAAIIQSLFLAEDGSDIRIQDLTVIGNSRAIANSASGGFFIYRLTPAAKASAARVSIANVKLQNFAAERWISFINANPSGRILSDVAIENVSIISRPGNSLAPDKLSVWSHGIVVMGDRGMISRVRITNLDADATYIKSGVGILRHVSDVRIDNARIRSAGRVGAKDDAGGYAIALYGGAGEVSRVVVERAAITSPRSAGLYVAGAEDVSVIGPMISGQSDSASATLPKGALSFNSARNIRVTGGRLSGNAVDIDMVARADETTPIDAVIDGVQTSGARLASIVVNPGSGTGTVGNVTIRNSRLDAAGRALQVLNGIGPARVIGGLVVEGSTFSSTSTNALELSPFQAVRLQGYVLRDLRIRAKGIAVAAQSASGHIAFDNVDAEGLGPASIAFLFGEGLRLTSWSRVRTRHIAAARIAPGRQISASSPSGSPVIDIISIR